MTLKEVLEANKVPLPPDFDERFKLVIMGLRKDPKFEEELKNFKEQTGGLKLSGMSDKLKSGISSAKNRVNSGLSSAKNRVNSGLSFAKDIINSATDKTPATQNASFTLAPPMEIDSEDWMGPRIRWFLGAVTSPYARVMLRGLFMVIFFVSYLEAIPVFGGVLSSALDVMVAGHKALTKTIQKQIPVFMGLIPLPFASLIGLVMAAFYGAIAWPMIAIVAFSRQDFTAAIESFIRVIPPPIGDTIADLFLEGNRVVARLEAKRQKLASDIIIAIGTIANIIEEVSQKVNNGVSKVNAQISQKVNNGVSKVNAQIERASQMKDEAIENIKDNVSQIKTQIKDDTVSTIKEIVDVTREPKEATVEKVAEPPKSSLQDAFSDLKKNPPTAKQVSTSLRNLSSKIKESAKPRASFEPTPVGQGRKRLSTRRRVNSKWMTTQRIRFAKH